jgi:very-short-patch-repair endonuclease
MKRLSLRPEAIPRARELRRDMTPYERKLWRALRENFPEAHFRKQVPLGLYTADFAWHTAKLIIEVDGDHHGTEVGKARDMARTAFLEGEGYRVIRFWNNDIDRNLEGVIAAIAEALSSTVEENIGAQTCAAPTLPSPQGGGEIGVH